MRVLSRIVGWVLLIPCLAYLTAQGIYCLSWLVGRSNVTWNIPLLIFFFVTGMIGEGLRKYGNHEKIW